MPLKMTEEENTQGLRLMPSGRQCPTVLNCYTLLQLFHFCKTDKGVVGAILLLLSSPPEVRCTSAFILAICLLCFSKLFSL